MARMKYSEVSNIHIRHERPSLPQRLEGGGYNSEI